MKYTLMIAALLLSTFSFAKNKNFEVQIKEVSINGSIQAQPRKVNVNSNQPIVISKSIDTSGVNTIVGMTVTDDNSKIKDGILIKLSIIEEKEGSKKIIGSPQIIVKSGYEAQVTEGKEGETPMIKVTLVGTRIQ